MASWTALVVEVTRQSTWGRTGKERREGQTANGKRQSCEESCFPPFAVCQLPIADNSLNGWGGSSPRCSSRLFQSMVLRLRRGGVPVLSRPSSKPSSRRAWLMPTAVPSPARPPSVCCSPVCMRARMKVPVVRTMEEAERANGKRESAIVDGTSSFADCRLPFASALGVTTTPFTEPPSTTRRSTVPPITVISGRLAIIACTVRAYACLSHWARGPRTAAPLLVLRTLKLDAGRVCGEAHEAAEGVDFADDLALGKPAVGGVAGT